MGAETSQNMIVDLEKVTENRTAKPWESKDADIFLNTNYRGTTMLDDALPIIQDMLRIFEKPVHILEVGSGNGYNTERVSNLNNTASLKATDIYDYPKKYYEVSVESSADAVKNYDGDIDILLMICPPPNLYVDYYAIKEYELKKQSAPKYLIFVGELGAADGTEGIYQYLTNEACKQTRLSNWEVISRELYDRVESYVGEIEREVWLFEFNE